MGNVKLIWVNINKVIPNPINPRTDLTVKTIEMQQIIKEKGWETGITCYEQDSQYIILSGHRRWFAAKKLKIREVPVILVKAPKTKEEELKRLGSVQGGKEDWTDYEWAKYTYEMWIGWEKCPFEELAKKMRRSSRWVAERVRVFQYYPHDEIEDGFIKGSLNITVLYRLIGWLEKFADQRARLVSTFSLDMIRSTMLNKIENRLVSVADLKNERFIHEPNDEQVKRFFLDSKMKLSECLLMVESDSLLEEEKKSSSCQQRLRNITACINQLNIDIIPNAQETLIHFNHIRDAVIKKQRKVKELI